MLAMAAATRTRTAPPMRKMLARERPRGARCAPWGAGSGLGYMPAPGSGVIAGPAIGPPGIGDMDGPGIGPPGIGDIARSPIGPPGELDGPGRGEGWPGRGVGGAPTGRQL